MISAFANAFAVLDDRVLGGDTRLKPRDLVFSELPTGLTVALFALVDFCRMVEWEAGGGGQKEVRRQRDTGDQRTGSAVG